MLVLVLISASAVEFDAENSLKLNIATPDRVRMKVPAALSAAARLVGEARKQLEFIRNFRANTSLLSRQILLRNLSAQLRRLAGCLAESEDPFLPRRGPLAAQVSVPRILPGPKDSFQLAAGTQHSTQALSVIRASAHSSFLRKRLRHTQSWADDMGYHCPVAEDLAGLAVLFSALVGYPTQAADSNCCTWSGVECAEGTSGAVRRLSLRGGSAVAGGAQQLALSGTLPADLRMAGLESLDLSQNRRISGHLPAEWAEGLPRLTTLLLLRTAVNGTLPQQWRRMQLLEELYLEETLVSGALPVQWADMPRLRVLALDGTLISGTLPEVWGSFPSLSELYLDDTSISGHLPAAWANTSQISWLALAATHISGILPPEWMQMQQLGWLMLSRTGISGTLPPSWAQMPRLQYLYVSHTNLEGSLPPEWAVSGLRRLLLFQTGISGTLPAEWAAMAMLEHLALFQTRISGSVPKEWANGMPQLVTLQLGSTLISDFPPLLPPALLVLVLSGNNLSGRIPCYPYLLELYVERNPIDGLDSNCVYDMTSLSIGETSISALPSNFSDVMPNLMFLSARRLPRLRELPQVARNSGLVLDIAENSLDLSKLTALSLLAPKHVDFTPSVGYQPPVDFIVMCNLSCAISGPYTAGATGLPSASPPSFCLKADQDIAVVFDQSALSAGDFTRSVSVSIVRFSGFPLYFDYSSSTLVNAVLVPKLVALSPADLPAGLEEGLTPQWHDAPISFGPFSKTIQFLGLQETRLLYGVEYALKLTAYVSGFGATLGAKCKTPPHVYSYTVRSIFLKECDAGLVGGNFTQACFLCPPAARCAGTKIFAAFGAKVWRPSANVLPFYDCRTSACAAGEHLDGVGMECREGNEGPLCGVCSEGFARGASDLCSPCSGRVTNSVVVVAVVVVAFAIVTLTTMTSAAPEEDTGPSYTKLFVGAVRLFTNHFSLFGILAQTEIAATLSQAVQQSLLAQSAASSPSPLENAYFACLFPAWTHNDRFAAITLIVPALVVVELLLVRLRHGYWAGVSVSAAVLQLSYMQVMGVAARMLRHRRMIFYDSSAFLLFGSLPSTQAVVTYDVLEVDPRIDYEHNGSYWVTAWAVLVVYGLGIPGWFVAAYTWQRAQHSEEAARSKLLFLVNSYKAERWYWETVVTARKGLAVVIVGALAQYPIVQLQAMSLLYLTYAFGHEHLCPFSTETRTIAERTSYFGAVFTANSMLVAFVVGSDSTASSAVFVAVTLLVQVCSFAVLIHVVTAEARQVRDALRLDKSDSKSPGKKREEDEEGMEALPPSVFIATDNKLPEQDHLLLVSATSAFEGACRGANPQGARRVEDFDSPRDTGAEVEIISDTPRNVLVVSDDDTELHSGAVTSTVAAVPHFSRPASTSAAS